MSAELTNDDGDCSLLANDLLTALDLFKQYHMSNGTQDAST